VGRRNLLIMKQSHLDLLAIFLAELIGTGLLVFLGCMGCINSPHYTPTHISIALGFGLAVMLIINTFGCVSGAHLNPAISVAAVVYKLIPVSTAFVYAIGQIIGGYLGYGLLRVVTPSEYYEGSDAFCVSQPTVGTFQGLVIEFLITMCLIFVFCGVVDPRNAKHHDSVPLRFGLTVTGLALIAGSYSGGSMNPARSFGPALYNWYWDKHWIYWVGPLAAGLITSVAYKLIFYREAPKTTNQLEEHPLRDKNNV